MKIASSFISTFTDGSITKRVELFYNKYEEVIGNKITIQSDDICDMHEVFTSVVVSMDRDIAEGFSIVGMDKIVDAHQGVFVTYVGRRK